MQTVTGPVWLLAVLGVLAVIGAVAVFWVAAGWAERAADWWHDRQRSQLPGMSGFTSEGCDEEEPGGYHHCWRDAGHDGPHWFTDEEPPPLPPERTWEQMTSHQLPVVGMSPAERKDWQRRERARKRQAKRVEMTHRAHYVAMGFDYPSGLMERVRELTP